MTPEERQLLSQLFGRIRDASHTPRDREAEAFIADAVREQPYAPYLMAQTVIIQEEALKQAGARIEALEAELKSKQAEAPGSFLGGIGKSIFGGGSVPSVGQRTSQPEAPRASPWGQSPGAPQAAPQMGQPMGQPGQTFTNPMFGGQTQGGGGGFLQTAMATAAGVAGGALLAHGLQSMFSGGAHAAQNPQALADNLLPSTPAATEGGMIPDIFGPDDPGLTEANFNDNDGFDTGGDASGGDDWA